MMQRYREIQCQKAAGEREEGFTLIELLIVIVVMGILAAVVIFALGGVTGSSAISACNTDAKSVEVAVAAFNSQNPTVQVTQALLTGTADGGPYLHTWPSNPTYYTISLSGTLSNTVVQVQPTGAGSAAVNYDTETGTTVTLGGCGAA